jgi:AcrR family transcriptional regulator
MDVSIVRRPPFGSNPLVGERGTDTQRRILEAALAVFGEVGFAEARVELITAQAGCSRPAFYQYFSSKDDVFWALAGQLGKEMVGLAKRLERVTPDADGLAHLTGWIGEFMALHEAWAPVFASFQAASRDHEPQARSSSSVSDRTGVALLRAFGVEEDAANGRLITSLVAVLIRCSFYAEQTPGDMSPQPLVDGLAQLFHRIFEGPIDGVNVRRSGPVRRRRIAAPALEPSDDGRTRRPRGEQTRLRLLEAGAVVLPERGYHDARVDDIVAAAGVSHGTFYRYFQNKDDFFRVLAEAASKRMIELVNRLRLDADVDELRAWLQEWFRTYEADGGVISTWQEMQTNDELAAFSQRVAATVFNRLVRILEGRDFGNPEVDATTLLALIERVPYSVYTLGFTSEADAIESMITTIRRGFLALDA